MKETEKRFSRNDLGELENIDNPELLEKTMRELLKEEVSEIERNPQGRDDSEVQQEKMKPEIQKQQEPAIDVIPAVRSADSEEKKPKKTAKPERKAAEKKTAAGNPAKRKPEKKKRNKKEHGRQYEIRIVSVIIGAMILSMLAYFIYFEVYGKEAVLVNKLNNRTKNMEQSVVKGSILSADGVALAENQDGVRVYPYGDMFAHTIGYPVLGGLGLEGSQKINLLTSHVDFLTQMRNELVGEKSQGDELITTLDFGLQKFCYDQLGQRNGCITVVEPKTGKILAMVSSPGFDPNTIEEQWNDIVSQENTSGNLLNRATQCTYPPGSTFKVLTLLEYIRENPDTWQDFHYSCNGTYVNGDLVMKCHEGEAHGELDIYGALAQSCNGAFDTMGQTLDAKKWQKLAEDFGYNKKQLFDSPYKAASFNVVDDDSVWNRMQMAIGQGTTLTSPLLNLMDFCAIANGGVMMKPYLIDSFVSEDGAVVKKNTPSELMRVCSESEAELLKSFLIKGVAEGSGAAAGCAYCQSAGKTGSAQYNSQGNFHAWFCGFAPADDPDIAVCVFIEGGGSGGMVAAPVAGNIFNYYFSR